MEGFNPKKESEGFGDTIAKFTHATGIDKVADSLAKAIGQEDCGCNKRRKVLNKLIPYNQRDEIIKDNKVTSFKGSGTLTATPKSLTKEELRKNYQPLDKLEGSYIVNESFNLEQENVKFKKGEILNIDKNHPLYMYVPGYYYNHIIKKIY